MDRRKLLKGAMSGVIAVWASPLARGQQAAAANGVRRLTNKIAVVDGGGSNVVALSTGDGLLLVDSGVPKYGEKLVATLKDVAANSKVHTLFNTHYHLDQTGNNELFTAAGAKIIAHDRPVNGCPRNTGCRIKIVTRKRVRRPRGRPNVL